MATILPGPIQTTTLIIAYATLATAIAGAAEPQASVGQSEFHFARMAFGAYRSQPSSNRREPWLRDWPEAETHLIQGVREFLLRGDFLIADDFHGPNERITFSESLRRVFPNRPIAKIPSDDEVFNVLYTLDQRVQIPGAQAIQYGATWEHPQGKAPHWRGIYDDFGWLAGGGCQFQHGSRRRLGTCRRCVLPGAVNSASLPLRNQLHHLLDDALSFASSR